MLGPEPIPPMHQLIEDYGVQTQALCMFCRNRGRFRFLHQIVFQEAGKKQLRDFFLACPHCDVSEENREVA